MQRTFEFSIALPNGGGCIHVTASGASEMDARRAVYAQYPRLHHPVVQGALSEGPEARSWPPPPASGIGVPDLHFKCGNCGKRLAIDAEGVSSRVQCPACGFHLTVPEPAVEASCAGCGQAVLGALGLAGEEVECQGCGASVALPSPPSAASPGTERPRLQLKMQPCQTKCCPHCGNEVPASETVCGRCGSAVEEPAVENMSAAPSPSLSKAERAREIWRTLFTKSVEMIQVALSELPSNHPGRKPLEVLLSNKAYLASPGHLNQIFGPNTIDSSSLYAAGFLVRNLEKASNPNIDALVDALLSEITYRFAGDPKSNAKPKSYDDRTSDAMSLIMQTPYGHETSEQPPLGRPMPTPGFWDKVLNRKPPEPPGEWETKASAFASPDVISMISAVLQKLFQIQAANGQQEDG
jgi:DNA-directed RNA polymerase subunit RPC12/RpoP